MTPISPIQSYFWALIRRARQADVHPIGGG